MAKKTKDEESTGLRIVTLEIENVKRITAIRMEVGPDGKLIVIGGANGAGKTSLLDSIEYAMGGKPKDERPVRRGATKAKIVADLGDITVTRTITPKGGGTLKVTGKDGIALPTPQAVLDRLKGRLTFDPLAFAKQKSTEQLTTLQGIVGLDFTDDEAEILTLSSERTVVGREGKSLAGQLDGLDHHDDAPEQEVSISGLSAELEAAHRRNAANEQVRTSRASAAYKLDDAYANTEKLAKQIEDLQAALKRAEVVHAREEKEVKLWDAKVQALKNINTDPIQEQIRTAETTNAQVRENRQHAEAKRAVNKARKQYTDLTAKIDTVRSRKATALAEAKFPVKGLAFDETGVLFGGLPFTQASSAEKLRVSVAMGLAMNPELRILLIRDGSLLDPDGLRMIAEMAKEAKAQVWMERVGEGAEVSVIIEDGHIKGEETKDSDDGKD